jgi:hypothetical protein
MLKKLSLLAFCIVGLSSQSWAQQIGPVGPAAIEYLAFASTGDGLVWGEWLDPSVRTSFVSPVLLSFNVPPSPKSPAVFLEIWGQYIFNWSPGSIRICRPVINFKITSPAIPNIEFTQGYGVPPVYDETNYAGDHAYLTDFGDRHKGYIKMPLIRGSLVWWWVLDKNTGKRPPDNEILAYIDQIIDNGFTVELWASGSVQGMNRIQAFAFQAEVTRLSKKQ